MGFRQPEITYSPNSAEEIEAAKAYVTRNAPDLPQVLGLEEAPTVRIEEPGVTHCSKGHEFTEGNTIWRKDARGDYTRRRCRICKNDYSRVRPTKTKGPQ